jgi:uncharacterized membrane protein
MSLITYGIKEENTWLQYGSIVLLLVGQIVYQSIQAVRSGPTIEANTMEANRVMNRKILLKVTDAEVSKAKQRGKKIGGMGPKMGLMFIVPFLIFMVTGFVLSFLIPGIPRWQSYLIAFLVTMPFSLMLQMRLGMGSTPIQSPNSYTVGEKGLVFPHMGRVFLLRYPLVTLTLNEEANCVEVEGQPTHTTIIPNKLRLFYENAKQLRKLLHQFVSK